VALIAVDEATLLGAATDVRAEIARLRASVEYLAGHAQIDALYVLVQDSLFLHHRNLATFLSKPPPTTGSRDQFRATDLVAAHYLPSWDQPAMRLYNRSSDEANARAHDFLNRHLAHLSTDRHRNRHVTEPDWWHIVEPAAVLDGLDRFLEDLRAAGAEERAGWFAIELAAARRVIGV
jgi:hypothetical protein